MAKKKAPAKTRGRTGLYAAIVLVLVVAVAAVLYARTRHGDMVTQPVELTQASDANELLAQAEGIPVGEPDAPVRMLVFSDYMCPGCAHWAGQIEPMLKNELIEGGRVHYTYHDFPLPNHPHSFIASRAARCAGDQGRFWEYHDRLFALQSQWSASQGTPTRQLLQYADDIGIDQRAFERCLRSDAHAEVVTANRLLGEALGVGGTPTVYVNGRKLGNREWQEYGSVKAAVQAAGGV